MIETSLVYIHAPGGGSFIGCGTLVVGPWVATCRHVWRNATSGGDSVDVIFPRERDGEGRSLVIPARLAEACEGHGPAPDLVILALEALPPNGALAVDVAAAERFETGQNATVYCWKASVGTDVEVVGDLARGRNAEGLRQFHGGADETYWLEPGSSGAPVFIDGGQQLAGIVRLVEADRDRYREAFVVPGTAIRPFLERLAMRRGAERTGLETTVETIVRAIPGFSSTGLSLVEIAAAVEAAIAAIRVQAAAPAGHPDNAGVDIDDAREEAAGHLAALNTGAALKVWDDLLGAEAEQFDELSRRRVIMLIEKVKVQKLRLDYAGAKVSLEEITRLDTGDFAAWAFVEFGDIERICGTTEEALAAYRRAETIVRRQGGDVTLAMALGKIGDALSARGDLIGALVVHEEALDVLQRIAVSYPENAERQRGLLVSLSNVGEVRLTMGNLAGALEAYERALLISRQLSFLNLNNAQKMHDLSICLEHVGDVRLAQGELFLALSAFKEGLRIRRRLANLNPSHAGCARDLSVGLNKVGDVLQARRDLVGSLRVYEEALEIRRRLADADPNHAELARSLSFSLNKIGDVQRLRENFGGALTAYEEGLAIARRLSGQDQSNAGWARDVHISLTRIGALVERLGDVGAAVSAYTEARGIVARLTSEQPENPQYRSDLAMVDERLTALGHPVTP